FDLMLAAPPVAPAGALGADCPEATADGGWCTPSTVGAPGPRWGATAVATSGKVLVFGGSDGFSTLSTGGAYDAEADTWQALADAGSAGVWGRSGHTATWADT